MKYPDILSKFCRDNDKILIGSSAFGLYAFLVFRWYGNKCQDFILSDVELSEKFNLSINTLRVLKKKLQEHNLIEFEFRNGLPCCYKMLTEQSIFKSEKVLRENAEEKNGRVFRSKAKNQKRVSEQTIIDSTFSKNPNIPSFEEFLSHAKSLKNYTPEADSKIEKKYNYWVDNGWNNDYNRPIIDWKIFLKSMLQYIIDSNENENEDKGIKIPKIKRPKQNK